MIDSRINDLFSLWIKDNYDDILSKWIELAKIPSILSTPENNAPFGENCRKALEKSASYFSQNGFSTTVCNEGGYALVSYGDGEKRIGLFTHSDVVPAGDGWLYTSPFEPIVKDGALIGRGVEDNKSGVIASLCVLEFLKQSGIRLKNKLEVFIGSDEECGMRDLTAYLKSHTSPDISFVPDADYPCSVGEKGILHFWLTSKNELTDILNFVGGEAFNIVLDLCTVKTRYSEPLFDELCEKTNGKNNFEVTADDNFITLRARGIAKHASIPDGSVNAAYLCAKLLCGCEYLCENDRIIMSKAATALESYYGNGIGIDHIDPSFGKTTAVNGMVKMKEGKLSLSFDVRYGDTLTPDSLEKMIYDSADELCFIVSEKDNRKGFLIDKESKIPDVLEEIFSEITQDSKKRVLMSGGTYARRLKNAFSVGTCHVSENRKDSVLKMPDGHGGPHQCDEMIDIEGFFLSVRILLNYILECDKMI